MAGNRAGAAKAVAARGGARDPVERFRESISTGRNDECWIWLRACDRDGYGLFSLPNPKRQIRAHRFAWELANGQSSAGRMVCHHCDNPRCCNPKHLYLGDAKSNASDRSNRLRCRHGETHHRSKLTAENVLEMRRRRAEGETIVSLGKAFGVNHTQVSMVCLRKNWRHV